jgi:hypothetical protein
MKRNRNSSPRAFALRATASIAVISVATILFASGFNGIFNSSPARTNPLANQAIPHPVVSANQKSVDAPLAIWVLGDVFAGVESGNYQVYDNAGTLKETINNGLGGFTTGCQFNPPLTQLYTTAFGSGQLVKFADADPHPTSNVATPGLGSPESVAFKTNGGYFVGGPNTPTILEFDASDNLVATHAVAPNDGTGGTDWIDVAANQTTLFYSAEGRLIKRFDTVAGQLPDFATLPGSGNAYAFRLLPPFDGSTGLLIADSNEVKRLDGSGNVIQTYTVAGVSNFFALNLDPDGTTFWSGSFSDGILYRFNIAAGGAPTQMINTGTGSGALFGVCLRGEITSAASPTPSPSPSPTPTATATASPPELEAYVTASANSVQNGKKAAFILSVDGVAQQPITMQYSMSGSAVLGSDYTLSGILGQVTIPAGESSARVILRARKNVKKKAIMTLIDGAGYFVLDLPFHNKASIKIKKK